MAEAGEVPGHKSEATSKRYAGLTPQAKQRRVVGVASAVLGARA